MNILLRMKRTLRKQHDAALVDALLAEFNDDVIFVEGCLTDYYEGVYESELDFATQLFDNGYLDSIPDNLQPYISYSAFAYDIFINDYFSVSAEGKMHIFQRY